MHVDQREQRRLWQRTCRSWQRCLDSSLFSVVGISPSTIIPAVISVSRGKTIELPSARHIGRTTNAPSLTGMLFLRSGEEILAILGVALLHTSPIIIVGIPAMIMAIMVAIICLNDGVSRKLQVRHTFFWLPLLAMVTMVSVGAWQYVANTLGIWPLVLVAVIAEAVSGCMAYDGMRESQERQDGKRGVIVILYATSMLILTSVGAAIWSRGMEMVQGSVPLLGFFLVWTILFLLALLVGKMAWHYMESGLKPILSSVSIPRLTHQAELAVSKATDVIRAKHSAGGMQISDQAVRLRLTHHVREVIGMSEDQSQVGISSSYLVKWYMQEVWPEDVQLHQRLEKRRQEPIKAAAKAEAVEATKHRRLELAQTAADGTFEVIVARLVLVPTSEQAVEIKGRLTRLANEYGPRENLSIDRLLDLYYQKFPDRSGNGEGSSRLVDLTKLHARQVGNDDARFE